MNKLIAIVCLVLITKSMTAQQSCLKVAQTYYRSDPFNKEFSSFLNHLLKDPTLQNITQHKKTDSTLYFFSAVYKTYSPFFFKATQTKVILAEREFMIKDSVNYVLPYYTYQLIGYAPSGEEGKKEVEEEFDKFCRKYKKGFDSYASKQVGDSKSEVGEIREYSISSLSFPVLKAAWASSKNKQENIFAITLSFLVVENAASLPVTLYSF